MLDGEALVLEVLTAMAAWWLLAAALALVIGRAARLADREARNAARARRIGTPATAAPRAAHGPSRRF